MSAFISRGIHLPMDRSVYNFLCLCCFELGLTACGNAVVHAHITYVLKSCCFSSLHSPLLLSLLISHLWLISPLICTIPPSFSHLQRGLCAGPRGRRRLAMLRTSLRGSNIRPGLWSNSTNTHCPWRTVSQHASACTGTHRQSHTLSSPPPLTSFHFSLPQALPLSLCPLMSSKMTSPPAPPPRPLSNMAFTNHPPFLHCQGSQVTNC